MTRSCRDRPTSASTRDVSAARRVRGLSDRGIAWLFIAPTIALLLAINIFPLIWMIRLSFTSLNLSMSYLPLRFVGLDNYIDILTDEDVWARHADDGAVSSSGRSRCRSSSASAWRCLINRQFRGTASGPRSSCCR